MPLVWKLFLIFLAVILVSLIVAGHSALSTLSKLNLESQENDLIAIARVAARQAALQVPGSGDAQKLAEELAAAANGRITLVLPDGTVTGDSQEEPASMENHGDRPEILAALKGSPGTDQRYSETLKVPMLYVAVPIVSDGAIAGVLRISQPQIALDRQSARIRGIFIRGSALAVLIAGLLGIWLSRRISRPLREMRRAAERFGRGDYSRRVYVEGAAEYVDLARAMNAMAGEIEQRLRQVNRHRQEIESILASMKEGVLAIDSGDQILFLNQSARKMFNVQPEQEKERLVQESIRHAPLQRLLERSRAGEALSPEDCLMQGLDGQMLQVEINRLRDENGADRGELLVLSDVTQLHRLETVRRDFVSNVSHELRTPITSIKGFVETLREGAINDAEASSRFLEIIERQADRLNAIITDLLALSRLEREGEQERIEAGLIQICPFLNAIVQHFQPQSAAKQISIEVECWGDISVRGNQPLLEQAVGNLLDNAIKYSPAGKVVTIRVEQETDVLRILVIDQGAGIPAADLPRIFERFYRVDPGRSREVGGTGLGLSIVKHIVKLHKGMIDVSSSIGEGSVFTISLPRES